MVGEIEINNGVQLETPYLTVGVINYNYSKYINRCLEAISRQKFKDFELIIADNDSTDNSDELIKAFVNKAHDFPITYVRGENKKHAGNDQRILTRARGKYIMFCDSDDYMEDDCLEELVTKAKATNAALIAGSFRRVTNDGHVVFEMHYPKGMTIWTEEATHCKLYKMSVIREHGLSFKESWNHPDSYFNYTYYQYNDKTEFVRKTIYNFCKHEGSDGSFSNGVARFYNPKDYSGHMEFAYDIFKNLDDKKKEPLEYSFIRMLYFYYLYQKPGDGFGKYIAACKEYRDIFRSLFPDYLKNPALKRVNGKEYARPEAAFIVWIMAQAEKTHTIGFVLWFYWLLSHFVDTTKIV